MITVPVSASREQNMLSFATKLVRFWTLEGLVDSKEEPRSTVLEQFSYNQMQKYISEYKYFSPTSKVSKTISSLHYSDIKLNTAQFVFVYVAAGCNSMQAKD